MQVVRELRLKRSLPDLLAADQQRTDPGRLQTGQRARQRALAAAGLANHGHALAGCNVEADIVDRNEPRPAAELAAIAVDDAQLARRQDGRTGGP